MSSHTCLAIGSRIHHVNSGNLNSEWIHKLSTREIEVNTGLNYLNSERIRKLFPE